MLSIVAITVLTACTAQGPRKINESNWAYELDRNSFEKKWLSFFNSLDDSQVALLGKVFATASDQALNDFEKSLNDLERSKFSHMLEAAMVTERSRREMDARLSEPSKAGEDSLFRKLKIIPGQAASPSMEDAPGQAEAKCLAPDEAYSEALAEGQASQVSNPLPPDRKDIEEISHRLYPFGFARWWQKRAEDSCVTSWMLKGE